MEKKEEKKYDFKRRPHLRVMGNCGSTSLSLRRRSPDLVVETKCAIPPKTPLRFLLPLPLSSSQDLGMHTSEWLRSTHSLWARHTVGKSKLKIILVGEGGVGKTSLLLQYAVCPPPPMVSVVRLLVLNTKFFRMASSPPTKHRL